MDEKKRHEAGMRVRREILGDAYVDRVVADTTDASSDFQDLITRYAWGEIWTRPGLDERTRRVLVISPRLVFSTRRKDSNGASFQMDAGVFSRITCLNISTALIGAPPRPSRYGPASRRRGSRSGSSWRGPAERYG